MKIEHGIPIPAIVRKTDGITAMLREMKPGDSFVIPKEQQTSVRTIASKLKVSIVSRRISAAKHRVWRVA